LLFGAKVVGAAMQRVSPEGPGAGGAGGGAAAGERSFDKLTMSGGRRARV